MRKAEAAFHNKMRVALEHCECDECEARRSGIRYLHNEITALRARVAELGGALALLRQSQTKPRRGIRRDEWEARVAEYLDNLNASL